MTSSHQNSNIFCCGVHFSQEWFSRIGQNHKISSSSLSRNVSILLLTKKIYSKINISRVISCYINQENIISNKKPDVTEYSYGITKWTIWSLQKDVLKSDPTISVLDMPEKTPELTSDMPTCLKIIFCMVYIIIYIGSHLLLNKMRNKFPSSWQNKFITFLYSFLGSIPRFELKKGKGLSSQFRGFCNKLWTARCLLGKE